MGMLPPIMENHMENVEKMETVVEGSGLQLRNVN